MVAYLFELFYDLCLSPQVNVSEGPGVELPMGIQWASTVSQLSISKNCEQYIHVGLIRVNKLRINIRFESHVCNVRLVMM